jgi:hypothetical protein
MTAGPNQPAITMPAGSYTTGWDTTHLLPTVWRCPSSAILSDRMLWTVNSFYTRTSQVLRLRPHAGACP